MVRFGVRRASEAETLLTERQQDVLRAMVMAYVGEASPIGSKHISHLLPTKLSSASIRNTLAELSELGLVEQPHPSAGRVPTEEGLRLFIDQLVHRRAIAEYDRRTFEFGVESAEGDGVVRVATELLSEQTRLLGFAVAPRLERVILQHVSLVRLGTGRVLAVLVSTTGRPYRRVVDADPGLDQRALDRMASLLAERIAGRTLREVRDALRQELREARREAHRLQNDALALCARALEARDGDEDVDIVFATRLALLEQPEFRDPRRVRELFEAVETKVRLVEIVEEMLAGDGVQVTLGGEVPDPALRRFALVATHYGDGLGAVGVIGPSRMDYARVIPLVDYCSRMITEKLSA